MTLYDRRYLLHERLGAGGMGEVYRATDRLAGRSVALKRVLGTSDLAAIRGSLDHRAALAVEFQTLASLRHPNIVSVLDYGFDGDHSPYFTMALLEEPRTFSRFAWTRPVGERMVLVVEILRALLYLHRRGIVHRDLKPGNVLVDASGRVRVLDFGLSMARGTDRRIAGTVSYMAPEVLRGEGATEASDLYAVGVMAFEILAGVRPFNGPDTQSIVSSVLRDEPDFASMSRAVDSAEALTPLPDTPSHVDADSTALPESSTRDSDTRSGATVSRAEAVQSGGPSAASAGAPAAPAATLVEVVRRLLAKQPGDRYVDAASVIRDLSAVLGQPLPADTAETRESFLQAAPLIGRDEERARLLAALERTAEGHGRVVLLGGESGVGKSRLLDELRTAALVRGVSASTGQAVSEGGAPYQLWREPLRQLVVLGEFTDFQAGVLKAVVPDIELLLDRPVADPPGVSTDTRQERLLSVMEQLFAVQAPTLVILEDLHWARDSAALLQRLVTVASQAPLLVVGSYRHDEVPTLPAEVPGAEAMNLDRLSAAAVGALTEAMLGAVPDRARLVDYLHRETEGNAFFLVEVVRALAEQAGQLDEVARMALPERVLSGGMRHLIASRLERVPITHRARLRLAAALGRELDLPALEADADGPLDEWLLACSAASVLDVQQDRWRFSHDKLRETLLADLADDSRREVHRRAAEALEAAYPDRGARAAGLAHHWGIAGDRTREALYASLGGQRAMEGSAYAEAVTLLGRALDIAATDPSVPVEVAPAERLLGEALFGLGRLEDSQERLERAVRHLGGAVPVPSLARTAATMTGQAARQGLHRLAPSVFIGRARTPDARARMLLLSRCYERMGHCHYLLGRSLQTVCSSLLNLNASEQAGPSPELARSYGTQIVGAGMVGQHRMARMYMRLAREAVRDIADPSVLAWVDQMVATYSVGAGGWTDMDEVVPRSMTIYQALGDRRRLQEIVIVGACSDYFRGRFTESVAAGDRIASQASAGELQPQLWSTALRVQAGQIQRGAAETIRMLTGNAVIGRTWHSVEGIWLAGTTARCYLRAGDLDGAQREAARALELMPTSPPVAGFVLEGYAGAAEALLALWAGAGSEAARGARHADVTRCLATLERFAGTFPVGEPRAALCRGIYERTTGRTAKAATAFERSLAAGERLQMPYETALAAVELGALLGAQHSRGALLLAQAHRMFDAIGATEDARLALRRGRVPDA